MRIEKIKRIVLILMLLTYTIIHSEPVQSLPARAPRMGACADPPCNGEQAPENPIDGGLSILLIAGTAFGIYELRKRKKQMLNKSYFSGR